MKTEPGKYYKNLKAQKWINRPSRKESLKKIIDEAKATDSELYASLQNDPARYVDVMNYKLGDTTKQPKDYPKTITKIYDSPMGTIKEIKKVKKPKKIAEAKPNGKYKIPELNLDSFDWDLWLRKNDPNYKTLEEEESKIKAPIRFASYDPVLDPMVMAEEYWEDQWQQHEYKNRFKNAHEFMSWSLANEDQPTFQKGGPVNKQKSGLASLAEKAVASDLLKKVISGKVALQFAPPKIQRESKLQGLRNILLT